MRRNFKEIWNQADGKEEKVKIKFGIYGTKLDNHIEVEPINDNELEKYMISIK